MIILKNKELKECYEYVDFFVFNGYWVVYYGVVIMYLDVVGLLWFL